MTNKRFFLASALIVPALALSVAASQVSAATSSETNAGATPTQQEGKPFFAKFRGMHGKGDHGKMKMGRHMGGKNMRAVHDALEKNDFNAFKEATKDHPKMKEIDEAKFAKLVRAHQLMKEARTLMQEVHGEVKN